MQKNMGRRLVVVLVAVVALMVMALPAVAAPPGQETVLHFNYQKIEWTVAVVDPTKPGQELPGVRAQADDLMGVIGEPGGSAPVFQFQETMLVDLALDRVRRVKSSAESQARLRSVETGGFFNGSPG